MILCVLGFCAVLSRSMPALVKQLELEPWFYFLMTFSLVLVFILFLYAEFNPRKNWHGFPYRLFVLPLPTWKLIAVPMFLGVFFLEAIYFFWAMVVFPPLGITISLWPALVLIPSL